MKSFKRRRQLPKHCQASEHAANAIHINLGEIKLILLEAASRCTRESSGANEFDEAHAFENFGFLHKLNTERFAKTFAKTFGRTCAKHSTNCKINKKLAKQNKRERED